MPPTPKRPPIKPRPPPCPKPPRTNGRLKNLPTSPAPAAALAAVAAAIEEQEATLRQTMLAGDADALNGLLADDTLFADQQGRLLTKAADLAVHRSGTLRLQHLQPAEQTIRVLNEATAAVVVLAEVAGTYAGQPFGARCRYVRVWSWQQGRWQVVAGSASNAGPASA